MAAHLRRDGIKILLNSPQPGGLLYHRYTESPTIPHRFTESPQESTLINSINIAISELAFLGNFP